MRVRGVATLLFVAASVVAVVWWPASAASPNEGRIEAGGERAVTWRGTFSASNPGLCAGALDPTCDHFLLHIGGRGNQDVRVVIRGAESDDLDLYVYDPRGALAGESANAGSSEVVVLDNPVDGTYEVRVQPFLVEPGATYEGVAMYAGDAVDSDVMEDCLQVDGPDYASAPQMDPREPILVDVGVLLDGVDEGTAARAFEAARRPYADLGIDLNPVWYSPVSFADDGVTARGARSAGALRLIADAKAVFGGMRPPGTDVVYVLTSKDLYDLPADTNGSDGPDDVDRRYGVAGMADCIGGVQFADHAFAVGEVMGELQMARADLGATVLDLDLYRDATAKVAAHELGHLLGAHHHYANCAEGDLEDNASGDIAPCTLMSNFADFTSLKFGAINGAVVRGHAEAAARP